MSNGPYVRITKRWGRNSGWAEGSWLYYVDLVNEKDESQPVHVHGEMHPSGRSDWKAKQLANEQAAFFGWPIREFEETKVVTFGLTEKGS